MENKWPLFHSSIGNDTVGSSNDVLLNHNAMSMIKKDIIMSKKSIAISCQKILQ